MKKLLFLLSLLFILPTSCKQEQISSSSSFFISNSQTSLSNYSSTNEQKETSLIVTCIKNSTCSYKLGEEFDPSTDLKVELRYFNYETNLYVTIPYTYGVNYRVSTNYLSYDTTMKIYSAIVEQINENNPALQAPSKVVLINREEE